MVIETPRAEIEARAKVTNRVRPLQIGGGILHQICLPWHFGSYASTEQGLTGDAVQRLVRSRVDANVTIPRVQGLPLRSPGAAGRRPSAWRHDNSPERTPTGAHDHPRRGPRAAPDRPVVFHYGREPGDLDAGGTHRDRPPRARRADGVLHRHRRCASAARPARSPAKQWNDLPADGCARQGPPTTTRTRCRLDVAPRAVRRDGQATTGAEQISAGEDIPDLVELAAAISRRRRSAGRR
jgi:hypothetical protein